MAGLNVPVPIMHVDNESLTYGQIIPSTFNPAIVAASYFASLSGCFLTVELLNRRKTGLRNVASWFYTFGCAGFMSLIGIWCMHFIGNRAIIMGHGEDHIQLVYDAGYTVLSVFLPFIGLMFAFSVAEYPFRAARSRLIALSCTGIFAGLSIVGMHYIGNFAITNYHLDYRPRFLAASIIIAIGDCWVVLALFYTLREKWINDFWKRLLCAIFLAGGVSAMHFTASTKCIYKFKNYNSPGAVDRRNAAVIAAGSCCAGAVLVSLMFMWTTRKESLSHRARSRQVTVGVAMFDPDGRILVNPDGSMPCRKIAEKYQHRTFDAEFDIGHPVFHWIYRVSRNWTAVTELIPKMKNHYNANKNGFDDDSDPLGSRTSVTFPSDSYDDFTVLFREGFCLAVAQMATVFHFPLAKMGWLYDKIIDTGILDGDASIRQWLLHTTNKSTTDVEANRISNMMGKGQLLLLTRRLTADEVDVLQNAGLRFAPLLHVRRTLGEQLQIPNKDLDDHLQHLKAYLDRRYKTRRHGTFLSFFALIPKPHSCFDVAVKTEAMDQLPDARILQRSPAGWQLNFIRKMDGFTTGQCYAFLENLGVRDVFRTPDESNFAYMIFEAMTRLARLIPENWFESARFCATPLHAYYSSTHEHHVAPTTIFSFVLCTDLQTSIGDRRYLTRIPITFMKVRHMCYAGSPNHLVLAREIHQQFGRIHNRKMFNEKTSKMKKLADGIHKTKYWERTTFKGASRRFSWPPRTATPPNLCSPDDVELVSFYRPRSVYLASNQSTIAVDDGNRSSNSLGGILVSNETSVCSEPVSNSNHFAIDVDTPKWVSCGAQGTMHTDVGTVKYVPTFIDLLLEATKKTIPKKLTV